MHLDSILSGNVCPYVHGILDIWRKRRGEYNGIAIADSCDAMRSLYHILYLEASKEEQTSIFFLNPPRRNGKEAVELYAKQLEGFSRAIGINTERAYESLFESITLYHRLRELFNTLSENLKRKGTAVPVSKLTALKLELYNDDPRRAIEELDSLIRRPEEGLLSERKGPEIAVMGSPIPGEKMLSIVEDAGFSPVIYDSCLDLRWDSYPEVSLKNIDDPFHFLSESYLKKVSCPRMEDREEWIDRLVKLNRKGELKGIIQFRMPFCDLHGFDHSNLLEKMGRERVLQIETDGSERSEGQIKTRVQAFYEVSSAKNRRGNREKMQQERKIAYCGIDVGSATVDGAIISPEGDLLASGIKKTGPGAEKTANLLLETMLKEAGLDRREVLFIMATGYGREGISFAQDTITEISCHARGAYHLFPEARLIIDIGGQDSKVIRIDGTGKVINFQMNDKCAAGTGRFIEVMAGALEMNLERLNRLALEEGEVASISSVCTVFAESEVVSLIARGVEPADIARGIFAAITRRIGGMVRRVGLVEPVVMTGGGALNMGLVKSMERNLGVPIGVAENPQLAGAIGAAILGMEKAGV